MDYVRSAFERDPEPLFLCTPSGALSRNRQSRPSGRHALLTQRKRGRPAPLPASPEFVLSAVLSLRSPERALSAVLSASKCLSKGLSKGRSAGSKDTARRVRQKLPPRQTVHREATWRTPHYSAAWTASTASSIACSDVSFAVRRFSSTCPPARERLLTTTRRGGPIRSASLNFTPGGSSLSS